jgi:hypothetical protein
LDTSTSGERTLLAFYGLLPRVSHGSRFAEDRHLGWTIKSLQMCSNARTTTTFVTFQSRLCRGESGDGFAHSVVHRSSTSLGASQKDSGISGLQRQACLEQAYRNEDVGGIAGRCGSIGVQTRGLGSNSLPHQQRFPDVPIILLSAYFEMPERVLWLVDEYVMKSELQERLVPIIERAHKLSLSWRTVPAQGAEA